MNAKKAVNTVGNGLGGLGKAMAIPQLIFGLFIGFIILGMGIYFFFNAPKDPKDANSVDKLSIATMVLGSIIVMISIGWYIFAKNNPKVAGGIFAVGAASSVLD